MNHTLLHFGFKKQVETKSGKLFDLSVGLSKAVKLPDKPVKCEFCHKYLANHVQFKHPDQLSKSKLSQISSSSKTSNSANQATDQKDVEEEILETTCDLTELEDHESESGIKTNNLRGANQRRSYTIHFKTKTLDLLDTMKELKTKTLWEKVSERRGVSKSLVVK